MKVKKTPLQVLWSTTMFEAKKFVGEMNHASNICTQAKEHDNAWYWARNVTPKLETEVENFGQLKQKTLKTIVTSTLPVFLKNHGSDDGAMATLKEHKVELEAASEVMDPLLRELTSMQYAKKQRTKK